MSRRVSPTDVITERTAMMARDPKHLRRLMAFWPEENIVHQMAKAMLSVVEDLPVERPVLEVAQEPETAKRSKGGWFKGSFDFNLAVRKVALQQGITLTEISRRRGTKIRVTHETLAHNRPTLATVEDYAKVLGLSLAELIHEGYIR